MSLFPKKDSLPQNVNSDIIYSRKKTQFLCQDVEKMMTKQDKTKM